MNYSKVLLAALAVMLVFAIAPMASAGDGSQSAPIKVAYVFADWDGIPFDTYPDLNTNGTQSYTIDGETYYINVTSIAGYAPNSYWANPSTEFSSAATSNYSDYDIVFVDMVNMYQNEFATGAKNAADSDKLLVAIRTGPNNTTCYMPEGFAIRDTPALSAVLDSNNTTNNTTNPYYDAEFTSAFFYVHDNGPGAVGTATLAQSEAMAKVLISQYVSMSTVVEEEAAV